MRRFGLIGKNISYSFSKTFFSKKFEVEGIDDCRYDNYDLNDISEFPAIFEGSKNIKGLNVTIPYKEAVIPYLDKLNKRAKAIGAVNTIKVTKKGKLVGYNTDYYGFKKSIKPHLKSHHKKALILGTGGASKGVAYALKNLKIAVTFVSRNPLPKQYSYSDLSHDVLKKHTVIVNCTPLGTHPNSTEFPPIPFEWVSDQHVLFDLIYNPSETEFLRQGREQGATICNGLQMLHFQAEKAWAIWNK